jgi:hypothetical protein
MERLLWIQIKRLLPHLAYFVPLPSVSTNNKSRKKYMKAIPVTGREGP